MMNTRLLNDWLGSSYTMEQVADMDPLIFDILSAQKQAMYPEKIEK